MITFTIHTVLSILMTFFVQGIFPDLPKTASYDFGIFLSWFIAFWLITFLFSPVYFKKLPKVFGLILYYLKELSQASIKVAIEVATPKHRMKPGIIAYPLEAKTDLEITLLANFITLTPGTLSIDVSDDRRLLYIHEVWLDDFDLEKKKREIKNGFERRILSITR